MPQVSSAAAKSRCGLVDAGIAVGSLMAQSIGRITWDDLTEAVPAFLVIVMMPL